MFRAKIASSWLFFVFLLAFSFCGQHSSGPVESPEVTTQAASRPADLPFTRHPDKLVLTKHARCRMGCRHITEKEIHEVLENGEINRQKSDPDAHPDPKYAMEGKTIEGQHLRIVFAVPKSGDYLVVVTCIELGVEWQCDCR